MQLRPSALAAYRARSARCRMDVLGILGQGLGEANAERVGELRSAPFTSHWREVRPELVHGSNGRLKADAGQENQELLAPGSANRDLRVQPLAADR